MNIQEMLHLAREKGATDLHIISGASVLMRINGTLVPASSNKLTPEISKELCYSLLNPDQINEFENNRDLDLMSPDQYDFRHRISISYNDGNVGAVIRLLPKEPISFYEIQLPAFVESVITARKGLVLITGSTSQGKTTTMASIINEINKNHRKHIVTIEDPIEYVFENKLSIIRQREVGKDTKSFLSGLRAALRQDPDIIVVGEMRDYETIKIALSAAETGILVLSTLHIISIDKIIERLLSYAPDGGDGHMRALLSESLYCVIHQELLSAVGGGKRVACEILVATTAVRHVIKKRSSFHLRNIITTGKSRGMQTMKQSLDKLLEENAITDLTYDKIIKNYVV